MIFESSEMYENITISLPLESNIKKNIMSVRIIKNPDIFCLKIFCLNLKQKQFS
jgi:hypothetical protein